MKNNVTVKFTSDSINESFARVCVASFISYLDPTLKTIAEIKTAVSEAVTNAIVHGYEGQRGTITMKLCIENDILSVTISDNGRGMDNVKKAMRPLYTSKPELERSGMGFTVMQSFMDSLSVKSTPNIGTSVTMTKRVI